MALILALAFCNDVCTYVDGRKPQASSRTINTLVAMAVVHLTSSGAALEYFVVGTPSSNTINTLLQRRSTMLLNLTSCGVELKNIAAKDTDVGRVSLFGLVCFCNDVPTSD